MTVAATASRIAGAFEKCRAEGRAALIPYVTAGYPTLARCEELLVAIAESGADVIEVGVPFSDPLADGSTVQATSQKALDQGTTLADAFELVRRARQVHGIEIPLLLMGYTNPFYQYGLERLAEMAVECGVDGFLIPDLPADECEEFAAPLRARGRDLIFFLAPTSTEGRIRNAAANATGFIYCVALIGVTGARNELSSALPAYMARVRAQTDLPLAIGFGIKTPRHVNQAAQMADGVVVASALIDHMNSLPDDQQVAGVRDFVRAMADATGKSSLTAGTSPEEN